MVRHITPIDMYCIINSCTNHKPIYVLKKPVESEISHLPDTIMVLTLHGYHDETFDFYFVNYTKVFSNTMIPRDAIFETYIDAFNNKQYIFR